MSVNVFRFLNRGRYIDFIIVEYLYYTKHCSMLCIIKNCTLGLGITHMLYINIILYIALTTFICMYIINDRF